VSLVAAGRVTFKRLKMTINLLEMTRRSPKLTSKDAGSPLNNGPSERTRAGQPGDITWLGRADESGNDEPIVSADC